MKALLFILAFPITFGHCLNKDSLSALKAKHEKYENAKSKVSKKLTKFLREIRGLNMNLNGTPLSALKQVEKKHSENRLYNNTIGEYFYSAVCAEKGDFIPSGLIYFHQVKGNGKYYKSHNGGSYMVNREGIYMFYFQFKVECVQICDFVVKINGKLKVVKRHKSFGIAKFTEVFLQYCFKDDLIMVYILGIERNQTQNIGFFSGVLLGRNPI